MTDLFDLAEEDLTDSPSEDSSSSPECGLYIVLPETTDHNKQCFQLGQALHAANRFSTYSINRHVVDFRPHSVSDEQKISSIARAYCETAQRNGFIFLVYDNALLAREIGADGVLCSSLKKCSDARKILDENSIIGLHASTQAMAQSAISLELDFVCFFAPSHGESLISLLNWWTTTTDIPVAIEGAFDQESCAPYVSGGATFIDSSTPIWTHPSGNPMQGVVNMLDGFERHTKTRTPSVN
ncbi:MAG TPA: thiamine phosphate synthase [Alphaproteobacteria bacterium]|nr:thiamine phosphate synthase [Alphaproteobacteria bacterium]